MRRAWRAAGDVLLYMKFSLGDVVMIAVIAYLVKHPPKAWIGWVGAVPLAITAPVLLFLRLRDALQEGEKFRELETRFKKMEKRFREEGML